jgi:L-alanine-DL-glutamate epimerase-like enolase superfamily enzyme
MTEYYTKASSLKRVPDTLSPLTPFPLGGLLESKKIADLADLFYLPTCAHLAASPLGAIASAHCAAAIRDFRAQEFSPGSLTTDEWEKFVVYDGPVIKDGKSAVSG